MKSTKVHAFGFRWNHIALVLGMGVLSFALTFVLNSKNAASLTSIELVLPVVRKPKQEELVLQEKMHLSPAAVVTQPFDVTRLNPQVLANPFGALQQTPAATTAQPQSVKPVEVGKVSATLQQPSFPVAAPVTVLPPEPVVVTAPALPFVAVGSIQGTRIAEGRPVVFLRQQDNVLAVRAGDSIDELYLIDSIGPERIEFIYLPLQQRQSLALVP